MAGGESAEDIKTKLARFKRERDQLDAVRQKFSAKEGSTTIQSVDMKENLMQWDMLMPHIDGTKVVFWLISEASTIWNFQREFLLLDDIQINVN